MERIILGSEPLPETETTITLDFFDPKNRDLRMGTGLPERQEREGKITFNPAYCKIFALASAFIPGSAAIPSQQERKQDFYLLTMPFTVHKAPGTGYYEEITFQISIQDQQTTVSDLFPGQIVDAVEREPVVSVTSDFSIGQMKEPDAQLPGKSFCFPTLYPAITAYGKGEEIFYWLYEPAPGQKDVSTGIKHILFVLQTPHGTPSVVATISGETMFKPALKLWDSDLSEALRKETESREVHWNLAEAVPFYEADPLQPTATKRARSQQALTEERYDVCVACALAEEGQAFMQIIEQQCHVQFQRIFDNYLQLEYYSTCISNMQEEPLRLQVSWPAKHGSSEMSLHLKPLLAKFRPRFAAQTGICAGDRKRVNLGDLIVAERAYFYEGGKFILTPDGKREQLFDGDLYWASPMVRRLIRTFDHKRLSQMLEIGKTVMPETTATYHIGAIASGNSVRADHPFDGTRFQVRDTLGLEMEGATFYRVATDFPGMHALVVKGVSDFADSEKNDAYHRFSSALSSMYMLIFIQEYVTSKHMPQKEAGR